MTASRRPRSGASRGRSGSGSRPRSRRQTPSSSGTSPLVIGGTIAGGAVVLALVFAMSGKNPAPSEKVAEQPRAEAPATPVASKSAAPEESVAAIPGKTPDRPAPRIPDAVFSDGDVMFREAQVKWNEAQAARSKSDTGAYQASLLESWDVLVKLFDSIRPYTEWMEEADFEDWAMPAEYARLQKCLNKWDPLRGKVRKLKPVEKSR